MESLEETYGPPDQLAKLFKSGRTNAIISWLLVGVLGLVFVESLFDFDRLWMLLLQPPP